MYDLPSEYSRYCIIGSTGSGDPICIDECVGWVVYLDHDDAFRTFFINSSIMQLAESLLCYRELVEETLRIGGDDAFLDGKIPESVRQETFARLRVIDEKAMAEGALWRVMVDHRES